MVINYSNSFRRYTPPTCTLEIYNPQPFWGKWRYQSFPQFFSFQLHFDDPRLPKNDRSSIIGDRTLLEKLRQLVDEYINLYLDNREIVKDKQSCDLPSDSHTEFICLSRESDYSHKLYYQAIEPQKETIEVILTNTQLLDLVNALEAYYFDVTKTSQELGETISSNLGLSIFITALVCLIGGGLWWRYEESLRSQNNQDNLNQPSETEIIGSNIEKVVPPTPLDRQTLPAITTPQVPEELKNRSPLSPPETTLTQPPVNSDVNIEETTPMPSVNNQTAFSIAPLPPPSPASVASSSLLPPPPLPSPSSSPSPISTPPSPSPTRLDKLPVLSSSNLSQTPINSLAPQDIAPTEIASNNINKTNGIVSSIIKQNPTNPQNIINLNSANLMARRQPSSSGETEIKRYFSDKWQPPENLRQSIEYRLQFNSEGILTRVTPIGQVAIIYLDRTNMPLLGEKIISASEEDTDMTIRLILSPNGNVQTFRE